MSSAVERPNPNRADKILEALHDVVIRYTTDFAIFPIMDTLQLLIQKPIVFSIIPPNATYGNVFTTFNDPEYRHLIIGEHTSRIKAVRCGTLDREQLIQIPATDGSFTPTDNAFFISARRIEFENDDNGVPRICDGVPQFRFESLLSDDYDLLKRLFCLLAKDLTKEMAGARLIVEALEQGPPKAWLLAREYALPKESAINQSQPDKLAFQSEKIRLDYDGAREFYEKYVEWMRDIVSDAFADFAHSHVVQNPSDKRINLFFAIRRAIPDPRRDPHFRYTVQYVLPRIHHEEIGKENTAKLEIPMGQGGRLIADWIFHSGTAEFSGQGLSAKQGAIAAISYVPGDEIDKKVRDPVEQAILEGLGKHFFFVPVHVGGVVWAVLFTLSKSDLDFIKEDAWTHNYQLYRVLMTQISERLRISAKRSYHDRLVEAFREELGKATNTIHERAVVNKINKRWEQLTAYFPYGLVKITDIKTRQDGTNYVEMPPPGENPHPCFNNILITELAKKDEQAGFDLFSGGDVKDLTRELDEICNRAALTLELRRSAQQTAAVAIISRNMSHNLGSHPIATLAKPEKLEKLLRNTRGGIDTDKASQNFLGQIADFLNYLRDRSDYIADIATSAPTWFLSYSLFELVNSFSKQKLLLGHLAIEQPNCAVKIHSDLKDKSEKMHVSLSHGVLGMQALYSIFENCLRNSVRYGKNEKRGELHLIVDELSDAYRLIIVDAGSQIANSAGMQILDEEDEPLVNLDKITNGLNNGFFEDGHATAGYVLSRKDWGLKEMKISAAFLRGKEARLTDKAPEMAGGEAMTSKNPPPADKPTDRERNPWINAVEVCVASKQASLKSTTFYSFEEGKKSRSIDLDNGSYLGFEMLLLKPKYAAIVGQSLFQEDNGPLNQEIEKEAKRNGIAFHANVSSVSKVSFPEAFLIVDDSCWGELKEKHRTGYALPGRIIRVVSENAKVDVTSDVATISIADWQSASKPILDPESSVAQRFQVFQAEIYRLWAKWLARNTDPKVIIAPPQPKPTSLTPLVIILEAGAVSDTSCEDHKNHFAMGAPTFVIFEHHGREPSHIHHDYLNFGSTLDDQQYQGLWSRALCYCAYSGEDEANVAIKSAWENPVQAWRLIESGLTWVLVLDERMSQSDGKTDLSDLLARCGVLIHKFPDEKNITNTNLDPANILQPVLDNEQWPMKPRVGKLFVTIHHGILKAVYNNDVEKIAKWVEVVEQWGCKNLGNGRLEVVIHSGRGTPPELNSPDLLRLKFLEFANVDHWFRRTDCKPFIAELLWSLRSRMEDKEK